MNRLFSATCPHRSYRNIDPAQCRTVAVAARM
jgi:hypothetical protein